jgi:hypothetical protein
MLGRKNRNINQYAAFAKVCETLILSFDHESETSLLIFSSRFSTSDHFVIHSFARVATTQATIKADHAARSHGTYLD